MKYGDYQRNGRHIRYGEWADFYPAIEVLDEGRKCTYVYQVGHHAAAEADLERYLETGADPTPSETENHLYGENNKDFKLTITIDEHD